jgi:hypothetical protein
MLQRIWEEFDYWHDICRITRGSHIEHLIDKCEVFCDFPMCFPYLGHSTVLDFVTLLLRSVQTVRELIMQLSAVL